MELVTAWCLAQMAYNATFAGLYGMIADHVPEPDRARVSGWFGAAAVASVVFSMGAATFLPKDLVIIMLPMPLLALPVTIAAYLHLRQLPRPSQREPGQGLHGLLVTLTSSSQYWWVWLQRLLVQLAYGIVAAYGLYFLMRRADMSEDSAATWVAATAAIAATASALTSVAVGRISGRRGSYGIYIVVSVGLIIAALFVKALGTSLTAFVAASLLVGVGIGCYYAVDLALVLRTVPASRAGQFLGFFNIARTLPQSLAPAIAPLILAIGNGDVVGDSSQNYFALYIIGVVVALLAIVPLQYMTVLKRVPAERDDLLPGNGGGAQSRQLQRRVRN